MHALYKSEINIKYHREKNVCVFVCVCVCVCVLYTSIHSHLLFAKYAHHAVKELAFSKYVLSKKAGLCPAGGGGLFLACEDFGRMFDSSFPACTFFWLLFKVEISSHTQFHSLDQDQSTVAQQAETTVTKCSLMSCM